jgi:hypothetical protein
MASNKKFDLAEWNHRLYVASDQLRLAVEEIAALCSSRGVDFKADWCRQLICAVAHGHESVQHIDALFEAEDRDAEISEPGAEPPVALYVKSH